MEKPNLHPITEVWDQMSSWGIWFQYEKEFSFSMEGDHIFITGYKDSQLDEFSRALSEENELDKFEICFSLDIHSKDPDFNPTEMLTGKIVKPPPAPQGACRAFPGPEVEVVGRDQKLVLKEKVEIYWKNYHPKPVETLNVGDLLLKIPTDNWMYWISQEWELELIRENGAYYLEDTCAGFAWNLYPLIHEYCQDHEIDPYRIRIKLNEIEFDSKLEEWPDIVGFRFINIRFTQKGTVDENDELIEEFPADFTFSLQLFDNEYKLLGKASVKPKAEILVEKWIFEEDDE